MMNFRRKLATIAAGAIFALCSAVAWAGEVGVGADGSTRFLWKGTNGAIRIQKCNNVLAACTMQDYGPITLWEPVSLTTCNNNSTYILWRIGGSAYIASIWRLDANLALTTSNVYTQSQFTGWSAYDIDCDSSASSTLRFSWKNANGQWGMWIVNPDLTVGTQVSFTQPFGWYQNANTQDANNAKAIAAMENATASVGGGK